jgi:cobalt-zinc-cadmium resistance protein CzcA
LENGVTILPFHQPWFFVGLKAGTAQPRSRPQLTDEIESRLNSQLPGVAWLTTTKEPQDLERLFPNTPAANLLMLVGPDLEKLESFSGEIRKRLEEISGIENVSVFHCTGQLRMAFRIDPDRCKRAGVTIADVDLLLQTAIGGNAVSQIVDGGKSSDLVICWPEPMRRDESAILDIPLDPGNQNAGAGVAPMAPSPAPSLGSPIGHTARVRLRDLVSPMGKDGSPNSANSIERAAPVVIYRKDGKRLLPIRFSVHGRPLEDVQAEAAKKIDTLLQQPYRIEWSSLTPK